MYSNSPVISDTVISLFILTAGAYALLRGWRLVKYPTQATPPLSDRVAVWIRLIFKGEDAAKRLREEITQPAELRRAGIFTLIVGCILLISGVGQLIMRLLGVGG
jgi:hypothetical protein